MSTFSQTSQPIPIGGSSERPMGLAPCEKYHTMVSTVEGFCDDGSPLSPGTAGCVMGGSCVLGLSTNNASFSSPLAGALRAPSGRASLSLGGIHVLSSSGAPSPPAETIGILNLIDPQPPSEAFTTLACSSVETSSSFKSCPLLGNFSPKSQQVPSVTLQDSKEDGVNHPSAPVISFAVRQSATPAPPDSCPISPISVTGTAIECPSGAVTATHSLVVYSDNTVAFTRTNSFCFGAPPPLSGDNMLVTHARGVSYTSNPFTFPRPSPEADTHHRPGVHLRTGSSGSVSLSQALFSNSAGSHLIPVSAHSGSGPIDMSGSCEEWNDKGALVVYGNRDGRNLTSTVSCHKVLGNAFYSEEKDPLTGSEQLAGNTYHQMFPPIDISSTNTSVSSTPDEGGIGNGSIEGPVLPPSPIPLSQIKTERPDENSFLSSVRDSPLLEEESTFGECNPDVTIQNKDKKGNNAPQSGSLDTTITSKSHECSTLVDDALVLTPTLPLFNPRGPSGLLPLSVAVLKETIQSQEPLEPTPTARPKNLPPTSPSRSGITFLDTVGPELPNHGSQSGSGILVNSSLYNGQVYRQPPSGYKSRTAQGHVDTSGYDSFSTYSFNQIRTSPTAIDTTPISCFEGSHTTPVKYAAHSQQGPIPLPLPPAGRSLLPYAAIAAATMRSSPAPQKSGATLYSNARSSSEWDLCMQPSPVIGPALAASCSDAAARDHHDEEVVSVTMGYQGRGLRSGSNGYSRNVAQSPSPLTPSYKKVGIGFRFSTPSPAPSALGPVQWTGGKPFSESDPTRSPDRRPSVMLKGTDARPPQSARRRSSIETDDWEGQNWASPSFGSSPFSNVGLHSRFCHRARSADPFTFFGAESQPLYRLTPHHNARHTPMHTTQSKSLSGSQSGIGNGGHSSSGSVLLQNTPIALRRESHTSSVNGYATPNEDLGRWVTSYGAMRYPQQLDTGVSSFAMPMKNRVPSPIVQAIKDASSTSLRPVSFDAGSLMSRKRSSDATSSLLGNIDPRFICRPSIGSHNVVIQGAQSSTPPLKDMNETAMENATSPQTAPEQGALLSQVSSGLLPLPVCTTGMARLGVSSGETDRLHELEQRLASALQKIESLKIKVKTLERDNTQESSTAVLGTLFGSVSEWVVGLVVSKGSPGVSCSSTELLSRNERMSSGIITPLDTKRVESSSELRLLATSAGHTMITPAVLSPNSCVLEHVDSEKMSSGLFGPELLGSKSNPDVPNSRLPTPQTPITLTLPLATTDGKCHTPIPDPVHVTRGLTCFPLTNVLSRSVSLLSDLTAVSDGNATSAQHVVVETATNINLSRNGRRPGNLAGGNKRLLSMSFRKVLLGIILLISQWILSARTRVRNLVDKEKSNYSPRLITDAK